jgi:hypothetical protein
MKSTEELIEQLRLHAGTLHGPNHDAARAAADRLLELSRGMHVMRMAMHHEGVTMREIAKRFGISPVTLSRWTSDDITTEPDFID